MPLDPKSAQTLTQWQSVYLYDGEGSESSQL